MVAKKKRKGKKGKKGYHKKAARHSTAKRGAAKRHTLKAGSIVTKKPNKRTLRAHKMHAKVVGKIGSKKAYKLVKNKKAHKTAKSGYATAMRERAKYLRAEAKQLKAEAKAASSSAESDRLKAEADEKLRVAKAMEASMRRSGPQGSAPSNEEFGLSNN